MIERNNRGRQIVFQLTIGLLFSILFCFFTMKSFASPMQNALKSHVTFLTGHPSGRAPASTGHQATRAFLNQQLKELGFRPTGLDQEHKNFDVVENFSSGI